MTSVSAGHMILTQTQPVGSGRPERESNPGPPHEESRVLPTELLRPRTSIAGNMQTVQNYGRYLHDDRFQSEEHRASTEWTRRSNRFFDTVTLKTGEGKRGGGGGTTRIMMFHKERHSSPMRASFFCSSQGG